jgi:integrase/recombinase XerC
LSKVPGSVGLVLVEGVVHLDEETAVFEAMVAGLPARRPLSYDELQLLFDFLDERVGRVARSGRKGALVALRDAQMVKTAYAFGLRRAELCRLELADLRPNPYVREWGTYGSVHVRYGNAITGAVPRRRTVLAVPEFDWVIAGLRQWVEEARPILGPGDLLALWVTERLTLPGSGCAISISDSTGFGLRRAWTRR